MKFGCFSLDYKRFGLEKAFQDAQRYGFDGLEIWGGRPHAYPFDMDEQEVQRILKFQKKYGIEVPMYTPNAIGMPYNLCSLDSREQGDAQVYFKKAIEACAGIECPRMLLVADHPGYEVAIQKSYERFIENVQELGLYAAKHKVTLVLESLTAMESPVLTTADACAQAIADIGLANVEAMMDVVPPHIASEPLSSYFTKLPNRMHYIHLCNNDGRTDAHTRLENGELPITDMLRVFKEHGFDGYVTVELYSEGYKDPELMLANSARVIQQIKQEGKLLFETGVM